VLVVPDRSEVQQRFRDLLREAHPDHGGAHDDAAHRIAELAEARRILLAS
jgi:curved DNA-binding protein CbpA